ncbi:MAG: hypothetical protein R3E60_03895 [Alphaproteobacteria bacterium]
MTALPPFSEKSYAELITTFVQRGYQVTPYTDLCIGQPHLILRHDIDMSLEAAVRIGKLEADHGWKSYYFIMVRSFLYNILTSESQAFIRQLTDFGHQIGLHFDPHLYGEDWDLLDAAATREVDLLSDIIGQPINFISFHRPLESLLGSPRKLAGLPHTYQPKFFQEISYCSDSRGDWHYGHPLDLPAVQQGRAIQLLTHPIWWEGEARSATDRLNTFVKNHMNEFKSILRDNCSIYQFNDVSKADS